MFTSDGEIADLAKRVVAIIDRLEDSANKYPAAYLTKSKRAVVAKALREAIQRESERASYSGGGS